MAKPKYQRLIKNGRLVGFKRIVVEFLGLTDDAWQFEEIEHDPDDSPKLTKPPKGIESLRRQKIPRYWN